MKLTENISILLRTSYNIETVSIEQIQGGWSALAYLIEDSLSRKFLLKIYDKNRTSTAKLTSKIDHYMSILGWLNSHTALLNKITYPLRTIKGEYKCDNGDFIFLLSKYIEGSDFTGKEIQRNRAIELATIISELHSYGGEIPLATKELEDDFGINFSSSLKRIINDPSLKDDIRRLILPYINNINIAIVSLECYATILKNKKVSRVLCHTDIHEGNLIETGNNLVLIDWEGLILAPREADFFDIKNKEWSDIFFEKYKETHTNYKIDEDCLRFYQLKRTLVDIWEFVEQLQFDQLTEEERALSLSYLQIECSSLK